MFLLIFVIHCLNRLQKKNNVHICCKFPKCHHITDVLMDFHWLLACLYRSPNSNALGIHETARNNNVI